MSYILESLKKSDQERHSSQSETGVTESNATLHDGYLTDTPEATPVRSKGLIFLGALLCIVIIFFAYVYWPSATMVVEDTSTLESPHAILPNNVEPSSVIKEVVQPTIGNNMSGEAGVILASDSVFPSIKNNVLVDLKTEAAKNVVPKTKETPVVDVLYQKNRVDESESINALYENDNLIEANVVENSIKNVAVNKVTKKFIKESQLDESSFPAIPSVFSLDRQLQKSIPAINYGAHIYASDNKSGFVILDGVKRRAGEKISNGVYIEKINEDLVVLSFRGVIFSLPAMKNWNP